jgi:4-hydroxythreonine-4-phosphate dehydrogenase
MRLALTPGEPAGIGPDLCVMLARQALPFELVAVADPALLRRRAEALRLPFTPLPFDAGEQHEPAPAGSLRVLPISLHQREVCGRLNPANAGYVLDTLRIATEGCLNQTFDALVTGPVHKGIINEGGFPFTGHTEFLAELCQSAANETSVHPVMMLATEGLRVALVTTHLPLSAVSREITAARLERVCRILWRDLQRDFGLDRPRILVCGLNPHAGENGHLGREEIEIIEPVLQRLRAEGMDLRGPLPADTLFTPNNLQQADAVLAMYHDQGLPVLKHLGFGKAVNITLGLPIIRTSVDHGTALDLAGSGEIELGSLKEAVEQAVRMAGYRSRLKS